MFFSHVYLCVSHSLPRSNQWEICTGVPDNCQVTKVMESDLSNIEDNEIRIDSEFLQFKVILGCLFPVRCISYLSTIKD